MSIGVLVDFRFKEGSEGPALMIEAMKERLPSVTRGYDGCENIYLYADPDDPKHLVLVERWASREAYERYREWAMAQPGTERLIAELESDGMTTRYLDDTGA